MSNDASGRYNQSEKGKATRRRWAEQNREKVREYLRNYRKRHLEDVRARAKITARVWRRRNPEKSRQTAMDYYYTHLQASRKSGREWSQRLKVEVLTHYGGGTLACVRCGFSDIRGLSIDHINGYHDDPKDKYRAGTPLWGRLKKQDYPSGYQTLCLNCNAIKRVERQEKPLKPMPTMEELADDRVKVPIGF